VNSFVARFFTSSYELCGALILRPRGDGQVWWILLRMWNS